MKIPQIKACKSQKIPSNQEHSPLPGLGNVEMTPKVLLSSIICLNPELWIWIRHQLDIFLGFQPDPSLQDKTLGSGFIYKQGQTVDRGK